MYENARKYNLTGADAMVFEALVYLCRKDGKVSISYGKLATFSCCGDRTTAFRSIKHLLERGIVLQNATGALQIATISKEERTKEEI
jgi:predicted transcriptional regulator